MTSVRAADLLVQQLETHGARRIFGVPGESYLDVLDALYDSEQIDFIICRQEGGAAMMAEAHGKLTGEPGICMVTRGPGATNASAGVHVAFQDSTPMILFIGQVARHMMEREAFQEIDYRQMFGPMAKWVAQIDDPARIPEFIARAYQVATSGRPGPVVLALPEDMLSEEVVDPKKLNPYQAAKASPSVEQMSEFSDMLQAAQKPLLIVGGSGWSEETRNQLEEFCLKHDLPIAASFRCQDYIDNRHPCYVGHIGVGIDPALAVLVKESDLIISLGARLGEMTSSGYTLFTPPKLDQTFIHIYAGAEEIGRVYQPDLGMNAVSHEFVKMLNTIDISHENRDKEWLSHLKKTYQNFLEPLSNPGGVQLAGMVQDIRNLMPENAITTNGAGNYAIWLHRFYEWRKYRTQLAPTSGSMGYGLPAAVAAAFEHPDRPAICFAGDGCLMMCIQELATAAQYGLNLNVIVFNNERFGTIRMHQEKHFPNRISGTSLQNPDFVALAKSFGAMAWRVEEPGELSSILMHAFVYKGISLVEIIVDNQVISPGRALSS